MQRNQAAVEQAVKGTRTAEATRDAEAMVSALGAGTTQALEAKLLAMSPQRFFAAAAATQGRVDMFAAFLGDGPFAKVSLEQGDRLAKALGIPSFEPGFARDSTVRSALGLWGE